MNKIFEQIRIETSGRIFSFTNTTLKHALSAVLKEIKDKELTGIYCD